MTALERLINAAEAYSADQSGATDKRCGLVQPITVAEGQELNDALGEARATLSSENEVVPDAKRRRLPKSPEEYLRTRAAHILKDYPGGGLLGARVNEMAAEVEAMRVAFSSDAQGKRAKDAWKDAWDELMPWIKNLAYSLDRTDIKRDDGVKASKVIRDAMAIITAEAKRRFPKEGE